MRAECDDTKRRSSFFQRENVRLQQQNADLSRQVTFSLLLVCICVAEKMSDSFCGLSGFTVRQTLFISCYETFGVKQDLSNGLQVRYLVKEIQEMKGGCVVQDDEAEVSSTQDSSSASRVITQHMVTFR